MLAISAAAMLGPLLATAQALAPPFPAYPELDDASTRHVLVVAEVTRQQYLPAFPECGRDDVICMDPPPTWFRAKVLQRVHPDAPTVEFFAATTDHFGPGAGPGSARLSGAWRRRLDVLYRLSSPRTPPPVALTASSGRYMLCPSVPTAATREG